MPETEIRKRSFPSWPATPAWLWPALRWLLVVAVVAAVGWQFGVTLSQPDLWAKPIRPHPGWLAAATTLYLVGLGFSAFFWRQLLRALDQRPPLLATLRAFYIGQLGRYVPGKVVGLAMRARLLAGPGVRQSVAVLTIVYETLTTLAAGVLLGLILLAFLAPGPTTTDLRILALLGLLGVLLMPGVFNRLAKRTAQRFRPADAPPLPPVRAKTLLSGLAITGCGWLVQGASLWAVVEALTPEACPSPVETCARCAAYSALAYAAGFVVFAAPGGLGVRDYVIQQFLAVDLSRTLGPEQAAATAVIAVLVLRLIWTAADVVAAGACWALPGQAYSPLAPRGRRVGGEGAEVPG